MTGRVLHLIPTLGSGGAERQLVLLAGALPAFGWETDVAAVHGGFYLAPLTATGATVHRPHVRSNYDPRLLGALARIIRERKPDVVQTWLPQMDVAGGLVLQLLLRRLRVPWIVAERSSQTLHDEWAKNLLRDLVIHRADAVISNSQEALRRWAAHHPRVERHHVPNAVPLAELDAAVPPPEALALRNGGRTSVILAAGRLIELKRFDTFIDVMKRVVTRVDAVGVICGDGPLMPALKAQAQAAGIADRIVFTGFVEEIGGWMKAADVVVGLSLHEGRPNVVIEAMACGTPLVVVDIPEYLEVVDATRARIVPRDEAAIAAAIVETVRDRDAAQARAAAARAATEAWSLSAVAASHASIYETLAPRPKGP